MEDQGVTFYFEGLDGQLSEDGGLVLELDGDVQVFEKVGGEGDDLGELSRLNAMVVILCDPDLKEAGFKAVFFSSAIEKGAGEVPDFRDMEMGRSGGSVGEGEGDALVWVGLEKFKKAGEIHQF